ncbi:hypothetical protein Daus18300_000500 [Diaporthe australafricana]|uniref:Uncharacterized protein n=1 Tax=Diaporthe australafricana TaxID=127596 RepID=A0ABR3Y4T0_9PEZI
MSGTNNQDLDRLMLRELESFRISATDQAAKKPEKKPAESEPNSSPQAQVAEEDAAPSQTGDAPPSSAPEDDGGKPSSQAPNSIKDLIDADEAAHGFQGAMVNQIPLYNLTAIDRKRNGHRLQRVYRLAHKHGVLPGARWIVNNRPYLQPAIPRSIGRADGTAEFNQFLYDGEGEVVLRMPGGRTWDLVRRRPEFLGVAVVDGYIWPRFHPTLEKRIKDDWEEQGFVEFNEVIYSRAFQARQHRRPQPAPRDGVLIDFSE